MFCRSRPVEEVVVLGAGFSKAIDDEMPTADELGVRAVASAGIDDAPKFVGGRFESWLSRLAEPQPDLSAAENARNAATFARVLEHVHAVMTDAQESVQLIPEWLARLVTALHFRRSAIVTFNYDTLVERTVESIGLWDFELGGSLSWQLTSTFPGRVDGRPNENGKVGWHSLIRDTPPLPPPFRSSEELPPSFQLLKLHGSLNWYWVPGDVSGATLNSWHLLDNSPDRLRRYLPGREPFIVPPAATKSAYFANPIMREIWRTAGNALRGAESVHFVGYSLPVTDLLSSSMIADGLSQRILRLSLVNRSPADPQKRLEALTPVSADISRSVASWAEDLVLDTARRALDQLREAAAGATEDAVVAVGRGPDGLRYVRDVSERKDSLVLQLSLDAQPRREEIMTAGDVVRRGLGAKYLIARRGRKESPIVGLDGFGREFGPGVWYQVLVPADPPGSESGDTSGE